MADLITVARAKYGINQSTFTAAEDTTLAALVTAVSKAVKRYCHREFDSQSFDELYSGHNGEKLALNEYPIISVARVAANPTAVLKVRNTSSANQRATVAVTSSGLTLVRVASGVVTTDTSVTFAGNVTVQAVADAVDALGNGWDAEAVSPYTLRASADLRAVQGALNAAANNFAELKIHVDDLSDYDVDLQRGWLVREGSSFDLNWLPTGGGWYEGTNNFRVLYTAGYATVPEDVQEACAQWVAALFWQTKENPAVSPFVPTRAVALLLDQYRKHRV